MENSGAGFNLLSFAVSGATTRAASDDEILGNIASNVINTSNVFLITGLTAGTNTFTLNYRVTAGTGTYLRRAIIVEGVA
jgi:hypothetical protein